METGKYLRYVGPINLFAATFHIIVIQQRRLIHWRTRLIWGRLKMTENAAEYSKIKLIQNLHNFQKENLRLLSATI